MCQCFHIPTSEIALVKALLTMVVDHVGEEKIFICIKFPNLTYVNLVLKYDGEEGWGGVLNQVC